MESPTLTKAECNEIYNVCKVYPINTDITTGTIAGALLKDPSPANSAGRAIVHKYDPGKNPILTIFTIDDGGGFYIMTCPRQPCMEGPLSKG